MLRPLRPWLPGHLPRWVPFRLRTWWARALGHGLPQRWGYIVDERPRWQRMWSRLTYRLHKPEQHDRSDGQNYVGWTARLTEPDGDYPAGSEGAVVGAAVQCGEFAHEIDFGDWHLTTPLPWPGIELVRPSR